MNAWSGLVDGLAASYEAAAAMLGWGLGPAILVVTFLVRLALVPATLPLTLRSRVWQAAYRRLKPEIREARRVHRDDPGRSIKEVDALYASAGIRVVDWSGLLSALIQLPVLVALFQAVLGLSEGTPLAESSVAVGVMAGFVAAASSLDGPPKAGRLAIFGGLPFVFVLWLGAGIGWYLTGVSAATLVQALLTRRAERVNPPGAASAS